MIGETRNSSGRAPAGPVDRRGRLSRRRVKKEQKKNISGDRNERRHRVNSKLFRLSLSLIYRNVMLHVCAVGRERQSTEQNAFFIFFAVESKREWRDRCQSISR